MLHSSVTFAAWKRKHPTEKPILVVKTKGKTAKKAVNDAVSSATKDLDKVLKQSEGKGVYVYTHGEMLPAHAYPVLKKYSHFFGHYGTAWRDSGAHLPRKSG